MNGELHFANNVTDRSEQYGTGAGFQFDFYCESCHDTWRSPFEPYRSAQAAGWLQRLSGVGVGLLSGVRGALDDAAEGLARAGWGTKRDEALQRAIESAKQHFHRCARCSNYVCDGCWSIEQGLCTLCAPSVVAEVAQARHAGLVEQARQDARTHGMSQAARIDVRQQRQLACPQCRAATGGGRFCPSCGTALNRAVACAGCGHDLPAAARFCAECGTPAG